MLCRTWSWYPSLCLHQKTLSFQWEGEGGRRTGMWSKLPVPCVNRSWMCCIVCEAGNNACAPLKWEDPVVHLSEDGGRGIKEIWSELPVLALLLQVYSPFLRGDCTTISLRSFRLWPSIVPKMCSYLSSLPIPWPHTNHVKSLFLPGVI